MPQDPPAAARITRRALLEAVWSKPMIEIAADHDTSAAGAGPIVTSPS